MILTDEQMRRVNESFSKSLYAAAESKTQWYDSVQLQKLLEEYRKYHSVIKNLISMLERKGLIQPDPYKLDKKISDIVVPADTPFYDNEKVMIMGTRLSDYESQLDFICNFFRFSVDSLPLDRIKKLLSLNNFIIWSSLVPTNQRPNINGLAEIILPIRMGSAPLSIGMLNDCISSAEKTIVTINSILNDLPDFQKALYKI